MMQENFSLRKFESIQSESNQDGSSKVKNGSFKVKMWKSNEFI